jgi:hypothetical protein
MIGIAAFEFGVWSAQKMTDWSFHYSYHFNTILLALRTFSIFHILKIKSKIIIFTYIDQSEVLVFVSINIHGQDITLWTYYFLA